MLNLSLLLVHQMGNNSSSQPLREWNPRGCSILMINQFLIDNLASHHFHLEIINGGALISLIPPK